jgi:hypothetical protein
MTVPATGWGAFLGFAEEVTWGVVPGAATNFMKVVSTDLKRSVEKVQNAHLGCISEVSQVRKSHYTRTDDDGGSFEVIASYNDSTNLLLKHALGKVVTTGAGPYEHDYTILRRPPAVIGLSATQQLGSEGGAITHQGLRLNSWEWKITAGDEARLMIADAIGLTSTGTPGPGPIPTFPVSDEMLHSHMGTFSMFGNTYNAVSISIKGDRKLTRRQLLGSAQTQEPVATDFYDLSFSIVVEHEGATNDLTADWLPATETVSDGSVTFTGIGNNACILDLHGMFIDDISRPISSAAVVQATITGKMQGSVSGEGVRFRITNDNTTAESNG